MEKSNSTVAMPDYDALFRRYAEAYNRSLGETVDSKIIRGFFAEAFVSAGVNGIVNAGSNDRHFEKTLQQGYEFYRAIGARSMQLDHVEAAELYENHDRVRVFFIAHYMNNNSKVTIPFDLMYLLQRRKDGPKIFAFIAGDEIGLYKHHGLVDANGNPS